MVRESMQRHAGDLEAAWWVPYDMLSQLISVVKGKTEKSSVLLIRRIVYLISP